MYILALEKISIRGNAINYPRPEKQRYTAPEPDITNPGPDTASFPTSPFTLPKDRIYFENFPIWYELPDQNKDETYQWPYLLRLGLTDFWNFE